jgi:hypothetical protein
VRKTLASCFACGGRQVVMKDGAFRFVGRDGLSHRLDPLTEDGWFTVDGYDDHLHIRLTGATMAMQWIDEAAATTIARDQESPATAK